MGKQNTAFWVTRDPTKVGCDVVDLWPLTARLETLAGAYWIGRRGARTPRATICLKFFTACTGIRIKAGEKKKVRLTAEVVE